MSELLKVSFLPLFEEIQYVMRVINNRDEIDRSLYGTQLSKIFNNEQFNSKKYTKSLSQIMYHAFFPLVVNLEKVANHLDLNYQVNPSALNSVENNSQFLSWLDQFQNKTHQLLEHIDISDFSDDFVKYREDPNRYYLRMSKLNGHAIQHLGQFTLLHGLFGGK